MRDESGYTLIELLTVLVIIGVLASLSVSAFKYAREDAEYNKALATLRNAETAVTAGQLDLADDVSIAYSVTDPGGDITGDLATILPGARNSEGVKLGASVTSCVGGNPLDVNLLLVAQPCKASQEVRWQRFCNGDTILQEHLAGGGNC